MASYGTLVETKTFDFVVCVWAEEKSLLGGVVIFEVERREWMGFE